MRWFSKPFDNEQPDPAKRYGQKPREKGKWGVTYAAHESERVRITKETLLKKIDEADIDSISLVNGDSIDFTFRITFTDVGPSVATSFEEAFDVDHVEGRPVVSGSMDLEKQARDLMDKL